MRVRTCTESVDPRSHAVPTDAIATLAAIVGDDVNAAVP